MYIRVSYFMLIASKISANRIDNIQFAMDSHGSFLDKAVYANQI